MKIRTDVFLAHILDDVAILDLAADDYSVLPGLAPELHLRGRTLAEPTSVRCREALARAGLLSPYGRGDTPAGVEDRPPPTADVWDRVERPSRRDARLFATAVVGTALAFPGRPVRRLLKPAFGASRAKPAAGGEATGAAAAVFRRLMIWSPWQGACLYRAFLLRRFLRIQGLDADWVFGVRTWPFQAHCWLQYRDVVLDDHVERVSAFTPILVG